MKLKNAVSIEEIYPPRVYINLSRSLADTALWEKLETEIINSDNAEVYQNVMISLFYGCCICCFTAVESFVNYHLEISLKKEEFEKVEMEDLKHKLKTLCKINNIENIASNYEIWKDFKILYKFRNHLIHYKKNKVSEFLTENNLLQPHFLMETSVKVMKYFHEKTNTDIPDYLKGNLFGFKGIEVVK